MTSVADDPIRYETVPEARRETVYFLARMLHARRVERGTRRGTRALGHFKQALLVLRWFLDATRVRQSADDGRIARSTAYAYLYEGIDVLAALAPDIHATLLAAKAAGATHLNLDGTLIHTDRVARPGPNGADLWWSGKHHHHGGNIQVISGPDGFPDGYRTYDQAGSTTPPAPQRPQDYCPHSSHSNTNIRCRR